MYDIVVQLLGEAAKGFARSAGGEIYQSLFTASSSAPAGPGAGQQDLGHVYGRLSDLSERIAGISRLSENLPGTMLSAVREERLGEAYRHLESARAIFDSSEPGIRAPALPDTLLVLLSHWRALAELEYRPDRLVLLPFWAEFVSSVLTPTGRQRVLVSLEEKLVAMEAVFQTDVDLLESACREAERIFTAYGYPSHDFTNEPPYLLWTAPAASGGFPERPFGNPDTFRLPIAHEGLWGPCMGEARLEEIRVEMIEIRSRLDPVLVPRDVIRAYIQSQSAPDAAS